MAWGGVTPPQDSPPQWGGVLGPEGGSGGESRFSEISGIQDAPPHSGGEHLVSWMVLGGSRWLGSRIIKISICDALKFLTKCLLESIKIPKFSRLRRAYCATGKTFFRNDFTLQNGRNRRLLFGFRTLLKGFSVAK